MVSVNVWVHVWRGVTRTLRSVVTVALLASASGCIDDEEFLDCLSRLEDVCRWQEACESTIQRFAICLS